MKPEIDESLLGYMKRRSDLEGFPEVGGFLAMLGQSYGRASIEDCGRLAKDLDVECEVLEPLLPSASPDDPALDWSFHRMHRDPVCPKCIAAQWPRRKEWRHALVAACAEHECLLIDHCPGCMEPMTVTGDGYAGCICGTSYGDANVEPATALETATTRMIAGQPTKLAGVNIEGTEGRQAARAIWFLCNHVSPARTGKEGKGGYPKTVQETRVLLALGEALLIDWPWAFDDHVVQRWNAPVADGLTAAMRLGAWYRGLLGQKGILAEGLLSRCLHVVGTICGDAYKTDQKGDGVTWVSATRAAELLGLRSERIVEAVRANLIPGSQGRSGTGHLHTVIRSQEVDKIRTLRETAANKTEIRDILGVSRKQLDLLEQAGFFPAACRMTPHPCIDGDYDLVQVRKVVARIRQSVSDQGYVPNRAIPFREINLRRTTDRQALLQIFCQIASNELRPMVFDEASKLGDALFDEDEIDLLLKQHGGARAWTVGDIAGFTGWKPECVVGWCEQGLLEATRGNRGNFVVWQVTEKALAQFNREFCVVSDLAKDGRTTSRKILKSCDDQEIVTVGSRPAGSSTRGHLIRSCDLARILISAAIR